MSMAKLDQALLGPKSSDGSIPFVRNQDGDMSLCVARPLREGQPVLGEGELVQFRARPETPGLYDCTTLLENTRSPARSPTPVKTEKSPGEQEKPAVAKPGPPRVTTRAYREGWDTIFNKKELN
jgi:hypothetical protein